MKTVIITSLLLFNCCLLKAQLIDLSDNPLMNKTWELIAQREYKQNEKKEYIAVFPPALKALENKSVELSGYIIATTSALTHTVFMLSVVPYEQCAYCGQKDIPSMVETRILKAIRYTDKPIKVKGKLVLNATAAEQGGSEFLLVDAEQIGL